MGMWLIWQLFNLYMCISERKSDWCYEKYRKELVDWFYIIYERKDD